MSESITFTKWFWSDKCRDNLSINVYHGIYLEYSFRGESRCLSRVRILCSCWYPLFILYMFHWWKLFQKRAVCTQFDIHCSSYTCLIDESYSRNVPCALNLISTVHPIYVSLMKVIPETCRVHSIWYPLFILYMSHWWKLFQKRAVCTQFDIYIFIFK